MKINLTWISTKTDFVEIGEFPFKEIGISTKKDKIAQNQQQIKQTVNLKKMKKQKLISRRIAATSLFILLAGALIGLGIWQKEELIAIFNLTKEEIEKLTEVNPVIVEEEEEVEEEVEEEEEEEEEEQDLDNMEIEGDKETAKKLADKIKEEKMVDNNLSYEKKKLNQDNKAYSDTKNRVNKKNNTLSDVKKEREVVKIVNSEEKQRLADAKAENEKLKKKLKGD